MKTRVSIINYSNTIPFTYGLLNSKALQSLAVFSYGYPSQVAGMLCDNKVDLSIISVGAIPLIPNAQIISKYCISATKRVDSVLLCSNVPLDKIERITLDYQSKTSNILVQILAKYVWNISPKFEMGNEGYEFLGDSSAKVIIGDRALNNAAKFEYVYDLASEWYNAFKLPFVFAAWVANKKLSESFIQDFDSACEYGINHIDEAIRFTNKSFSFDIHNYLHQSVEFSLNNEKYQAIELFFEKAKALNLL
ncbi:MAG: menaquinone biosynthesis protein [Bacteroidales bacterium]|nr:menaquinone biosynthesis protein [Bacteroidales bacterium]